MLVPSIQRLNVTQLPLRLGILLTPTTLIGGGVAIVGVQFKLKVLHYSSYYLLNTEGKLRAHRMAI